MAIKVCLFMGIERTLVDNDLSLPAVPAVGTLLHIPNGSDAPRRLVVRRVEMIAGVPSTQSSEPALHIFCEDPRQAQLSSTN